MQIKKIFNYVINLFSQRHQASHPIYLVITSSFDSALAYRWVKQYVSSKRIQWRFMVLPNAILQNKQYTDLFTVLRSSHYKKCEHIYLALDKENQDQIKSILDKNFAKKWPVFFLSEALEKKLCKKIILDPAALQKITQIKESPRPVLLEQLLALFLLLAILPLMIVLMILIKLNSDPGPCFYHQERVGQFGRIFRMTKFRSMRMNAETNECPQWASYSDPRSTKIGAWLRRTHLDELPQLWHVVLGQMSFIGPRPERPHYVEKLSLRFPEYVLRHTVRPGITGLAQVKYCYAACFSESKEKLSYDLYYIQHQSCWLDIYILLATVNKVFLKSNLFNFA